MATISDSPLGKSSQYQSEYAPDLLHPIPRAESRNALGLTGADLPFVGEDVWTGYEVSWLNPNGKPEVALLEFVLPCDSPNIVESKSIKLYLNSLNQTQFADWAAVEKVITEDLTKAAGHSVSLVLEPLSCASGVGSRDGLRSFAEAPFNAICLDELDVSISDYHPNPSLLSAGAGGVVSESVYSDLLKSNCPVTGQPDWASVWIRYRGEQINRAGLLRYIISFRQHQDFHEHCVERMFMDIQARCQPQALEVYARYTRRGGLDINPYRASQPISRERIRLVRQ